MEKLKQMRKARNIKVEELAKLLSVSKMSYYYYEEKRRKISIDKIKKLAKFYNCKLEDLID